MIRNRGRSKRHQNSCKRFGALDKNCEFVQRTYFGVLVAAFDAGNSLDFGFETLDLLFVVLRAVEVIQGFLARHVATIRLHKILSTNSPARETKASTLTLRFLVVERFVSYRSRRRKSLFAPDQP